jgi:hypothetical protein
MPERGYKQRFTVWARRADPERVQPETYTVATENLGERT